MNRIGSPEWFYKESQTSKNQKIQKEVEELRFSFLQKFSPEKLSAMNGSELLKNVFSFDAGSMMDLLMIDGKNASSDINYRWFGAAGPYNYLSPVYYEHSSQIWKCRQGNHSIVLKDEKEAEKKALEARNSIIYCISVINESQPISSIKNYSDINLKLKKVFFSDYNWALKYYQMVFPYFFPGMYANKTINRAIHILGLPSHSTKIENVGEISLFIRKCDINNVVFGEIYGKQWTWGDNEKQFPQPCENAKENLYNKKSFPSEPNKDYYKIPGNILSIKKTPTKQPVFSKISEKYADDANYIEEVNNALYEVDEIIEYTPNPKPKPPKAKSSSGEKYQRDPRIGAKAIKRANYKCELESNFDKHENKYFTKESDGKNYTEAHHIVPMSQQEHFTNSLDVEANIVSLCCTCHREIHLGSHRAGLLQRLLDKRKKELKKAGINISFDELFKMY